MNDYNRREGWLEVFLTIAATVGYALIVIPVTWLAQKIWRLDA